MESRLHRGNGGFVSMSYQEDTQKKPDRLAYFRTLKDIPPRPVPSVEVESCFVGGWGTGELHVSFYEVWSKDVWAQLLSAYGGGEEPSADQVLNAIREGVNGGDLTLRKIIKSPSGMMRARRYHGVVIEASDHELTDPWWEDGPVSYRNLKVSYTHTTVI